MKSKNKSTGPLIWYDGIAGHIFIVTSPCGKELNWCSDLYNNTKINVEKYYPGEPFIRTN